MNIKTTLKNIDKTDAAKKVVRFATTLSVGAAVKNVVREHVPAHDNPVINLAVNASCYIGGTVAAGYVLHQLGQYSDAAIDELLAPLKELQDANESETDAVEGTVQ